MFSIVIDHPKRFEKLIRALPGFVQNKALSAIEQLAHFPNVTQIKKLSNGAYRLRIGDYRILFDVDAGKRQVIIYTIGHRRDVYCTCIPRH
jgi:mRNA interferase RelE/StbE